jgi:hypothetical protein
MPSMSSRKERKKNYKINGSSIHVPATRKVHRVLLFSERK